MVTGSEGVRENVELDENWEPLGRQDFSGWTFGGRARPSRTNGRRAADSEAFRRLGEALARFLALGLRLLFLVAVFVMAFRSLRPHGGFADFAIWLAVGLYFFRRVWR